MASGEAKLACLRELMKNVIVEQKQGIQAYIITGDDAHQSEYIRERDKRRDYISGFTGSLGTALVTYDKALLWTDGRYFLQASKELDPPNAWVLMKEGIPDTPTLEDWLIQNLPANSIVGADSNLINNNTWCRIQKKLNSAGHKLLPIEKNLIDEIWGEKRPKDILNKVNPHPLIYSGKTAGDKVNYCFQTMDENKVNILVLTALDEIAYLLNWRGSDIPYNPVFFAYVILAFKKVHIFINEERLTSEAKKQLNEEKVEFSIHPYKSVRRVINEISSSHKQNKVWISGSSSHALHIACNPTPTHVAITPVCLMKLVKNDAEIQGMKSAHIRDAVALVKYFSWLENQVKNNICVTEISGATQLESYRKEHDKYVGLSFPTISSVGKHGSIIHYKPSESTDIEINSQELYLCDSGAQFLDGTTDVTRTLHFGVPSEFEKECFTRVFKGQYNLATSKFPSKIKGNYLDAFARKNLWDVGLDYLHGTGHGVGSYLNVHEYPAMISWRPYPDDPGLQSGMFLSNEPGYYEDEKFGIRLENIEMVVKAETKYTRLNREYLTFETVTLVPIQTTLLNISMLTEEEIQYINKYHSKCCATLEPFLQGPENNEALMWLKKQTLPIQK
ncbi:xaa-Pro aminopeptidase ApepP [Nasonia vitripennis]|uniref:Xaa-Pro aminopeptidase ApepP n=1 Tax=Nasonia vitripennis TaxID=7425 RepID=A0A7M7G1Z4_NASVI|nr:xaa-Pro aminopeptidase ApepP [Nasonia vitripennis]